MNEPNKTNEIAVWDKEKWTADDATKAEEFIKIDIGHSVNIAYSIGLKLISFKKHDGAGALGYKSFEEWCHQPDIAFGKATCYFYMSMAQIYMKLLHLLGNNWNQKILLNISIEKHRTTQAALKAENDPEKLLAILYEASTMSTQELKEKYGSQDPVIRGYGIFTKIVGKSMTINQIVLPYNASNQNYFKELYGKRVEFRIKLSLEPQ